MKMNNATSRNLGEVGLLVTDHISAMLAYWDADLICRFANDAYIQWFGKTKEEMIDKIHISELLGPLYELNLPYIQAALSGEKQLFEREIPVPGGEGVKHSLATYTPDFQDEKVLGFFVHVADVTYMKNLEKELADMKRELLRNAILTKERERKYVVETLRESINQRLAVCKMNIERMKKDEADPINDVSIYIGQVIQELNAMCEELTPTEIETFGLIPSIEILLEKYLSSTAKKFQLVCEGKTPEGIPIDDKISIFRIIQSFVLLTAASESCTVQIRMNYEEPQLRIQLISNHECQLDLESAEYRIIRARVEYFAGQIIETNIDTHNLIDITCFIPDA